MKRGHFHPNPFSKSLACLASIALLAACGSESEPTLSQDNANAGLQGSKQAVDPIEVSVEAMTELNYRRHVETLASDEFGGRAPASEGEELTVAYLVKHFENLGLEPAQ